jgi:hypothetical protein
MTTPTDTLLRELSLCSVPTDTPLWEMSGRSTERPDISLNRYLLRILSGRSFSDTPTAKYNRVGVGGC